MIKGINRNRLPADWWAFCRYLFVIIDFDRYIYSKINGKLGDIVSKDTFVKLLGRTTSPTGTITSPEFTNYQLLAVRIGISGWVKTEIFVNTGSYITAFINSTNADIRIRMDYVSNKITLSDFRSAGGTFNSCDVYGILPK